MAIPRPSLPTCAPRFCGSIQANYTRTAVARASAYFHHRHLHHNICQRGRNIHRRSACPAFLLYRNTHLGIFLTMHTIHFGCICGQSADILQSVFSTNDSAAQHHYHCIYSLFDTEHNTHSHVYLLLLSRRRHTSQRMGIYNTTYVFDNGRYGLGNGHNY